MNKVVQIRAADPTDAAAIAAVQVASWRTTYPGIIAQESIDRLNVAKPRYDTVLKLMRALGVELRTSPVPVGRA